MRFSLHHLGWVAGLALCLPACSGAEAAGYGGTTTEPPVTSLPCIQFEETTTLALAPGEVESVAVIGSPPAAYQIGFTLLGEPLDAFLEHAAFAADPETGRASVDLHAPSHATTFHLRASLLDPHGAPGASADRAVAVSEHGFASIEISPKYSGQRAVTEWTAGVALLDCKKDVLPVLPADPDGALMVTAPAGSPLVIENAPVGPSLAVYARAGHFISGCADVTATTPGATVKVDVFVIDKKLDLSSTTLYATFRYDDDAAKKLKPIRDKGGALLAEAFVSTGSKVGSVVLNEMKDLVPDAGVAAFKAARIAKGWDQLAGQHFAAQSIGLRQRLELWVTAGLVQQSPSFEGYFVPGKSEGEATFAVSRLGAVDAVLAGVSVETPMTWKPDFGDSVALATSLGWEPSRFAGAAALGPATLDFPLATSVSEALAQAADCAALAVALGEFGTCDVACVEELCAAAIDKRFDAALGASKNAGQLASMSIQATASAQVGDAAEPVALTGHFLGTATDGSSTLAVMGDLAAKAK